MSRVSIANLTTLASKGSGGTAVAFPDVCRMPKPPAPLVPLPYPNVQIQDNLKQANKADAGAKSGDGASKRQRDAAISNLKRQTGLEATSATQAVLIGRSVTVGARGDEAGTMRNLISQALTASRSPAGVRIAPSQTKVLISD